MGSLLRPFHRPPCGVTDWSLNRSSLRGSSLEASTSGRNAASFQDSTVLHNVLRKSCPPTTRLDANSTSTDCETDLTMENSNIPVPIELNTKPSISTGRKVASKMSQATQQKKPNRRKPRKSRVKASSKQEDPKEKMENGSCKEAGDVQSDIEESEDGPLTIVRPKASSSSKSTEAAYKDLDLGGFGDTETFRLGGKVFHTRDEIYQHFGNILHRTQLGSRVAPYEQFLLVELVKCAHQRPEEKLKSGVESVWVGKHPDFPWHRCFMLKRKDGSDIDFSYRKCINNLLFSDWIDNPPPLISLRNRAKFHLRRCIVLTTSVKDKGVEGTHKKIDSHRQQVWSVVDGVFNVISPMKGNIPAMTAALAVEILALSVKTNKEAMKYIVGHPGFDGLLVAVLDGSHKVTPELLIQEFTNLNTFSQSKKVRDAMYGIVDVCNMSLAQMGTHDIIRLLRSCARTGIPEGMSLSGAFLRLEDLLKRGVIHISEACLLIQSFVGMGIFPKSIIELVSEKMVVGGAAFPGFYAARMGFLFAGQGYYPGEAFMNKLVRWVIKQGDMRPDHVTWIWAAVVALKHKLKPRLQEKLLKRGEESLEAYSLEDLGKWIWGFGHQGIRPRSLIKWVARAKYLVEGIPVKDRSPFTIMLCLWSLTLLKMYDFPEFTYLWDAVMELPWERMGKQELNMIFQVSMAVDMERPDLKLKSNPELIEAAANAWKDNVAAPTISPLHRSVVASLTTIGFNVCLEYITDCHLFSVDIALKPQPFDAVRNQENRLEVDLDLTVDDEDDEFDYQWDIEDEDDDAEVLMQSTSNGSAVQNGDGVDTEDEEEEEEEEREVQQQSTSESGSVKLMQENGSRSDSRGQWDEDEDEEGAAENAGGDPDAVGEPEVERMKNIMEKIIDLDGEGKSSVNFMINNLGDDMRVEEQVQADLCGVDGEDCIPAIGAEIDPRGQLEAQLKANNLPKVAIEVDGPSHYFANVQKPLGRSIIRARLLKKMGWKVVHIPYYIWVTKDRIGRTKYLMTALRRAGVDVMDFL